MFAPRCSSVDWESLVSGVTFGNVASLDMSFHVGSVAPGEIQTQSLRCQKLFCAAGAILWRCLWKVTSFMLQQGQNFRHDVVLRVCCKSNWNF